MDSRDSALLMLLQKNGRASLTELAKEIGLSIDATHKRLKKLQKKGVIARHSIFIDPKAMGYELVVNVQVKLSNAGEDEKSKFLGYLIEHPHVIELISVLGDYDYTCVFIARSTEQYEQVSTKVRQLFKAIILDWKAAINLNVYKFERYDTHKLLDHTD